MKQDLNIDNPLLKAEWTDPPVYTWCAECEEPIYVGEDFYKVPEGYVYCEACMGSFKKTADTEKEREE